MPSPYQLNKKTNFFIIPVEAKPFLMTDTKLSTIQDKIGGHFEEIHGRWIEDYDINTSPHYPWIKRLYDFRMKRGRWFKVYSNGVYGEVKAIACSHKVIQHLYNSHPELKNYFI